MSSEYIDFDMPVLHMTIILEEISGQIAPSWSHKRESKTSDFKGVSEGTTTNGDYLLPFKTGAFLARAPVQPVILRYPYKRFSPAWDSMDGFSVPDAYNDHMYEQENEMLFLELMMSSLNAYILDVTLMNFLSLATILPMYPLYLFTMEYTEFVNYLEVVHLPVYYPSEQEKDDPKLYADNVRKLMAVEGNLILSDLGLAEKRVYHAALNGNNSLPRALHKKDD
uniref:Uncharacterized protein n=1 Tax=Aegilops tauschii TaxID=37682 RepID=R7WDF3_AEGTA